MATPLTPLTMGTLGEDIPTSINGARVLATAEIDVEMRAKRGCFNGCCMGTWIGMSMFLPVFGICMGPLQECNERDLARVTRLMLTEDALVLRIGDHPTSCRCLCCGCAEGASEKIVPLDRVTDLLLRLPGKGCVDARCPLSTVVVQTAGSSAAEIIVVGIKQAPEFKDLVMKAKKALERSGGGSHGITAAASRDEVGAGGFRGLAPQGLAMAANAPPAVVVDPELAPLLREIRDVLVRIERQGAKAT